MTMIKKQNEMVTNLHEQLWGGKGSVEIQAIFTTSEMTKNTRLFAKVTLNPNCSIGLHPHNGEEEYYYITKGKALVEDDGITAEVGVGDAILTGGGKSHSILNNTDEPMEFIAIIIAY